MTKKKRVKIIAPVLIIAIVALLVYVLKTTAEKQFAEGNYELSAFKYKEALSSYQSAGRMWPFIKSNPEYQKNLKTTQTTIENIKNSPAVEVFIKSITKEKEIESLVNEIRNVEGVKEVRIISQEDALKMYENMNKNDPLLMNLLTKDVLPASLEVYTYDIPTKEQQVSIISLARSKAFVERVITSNKNY